MQTTLEKPRTRRTAGATPTRIGRAKSSAVSTNTTASAKPYSIKEDPEFIAAVKRSTKIWADVPDHVAWVRALRNM